MIETFFQKQTELVVSGTPFVVVTLVEVTGSTPQDRGSKMLVTADGLYHGTVGGGRQEFRAIEEAKKMLAAGGEAVRTQLLEWNLQTDLQMVCGGAVKLFFERYNLPGWRIAIFGAGHVANALVRVLLPMDCRITCIDGRSEWLGKMPDSPRLEKVLSDDLPGEVKNLPEGAFVLLMTMGHITDRPILLQILRTKQFPYLGVIGSAAKAAELRRAIIEAWLGRQKCDQFYCPIGLSIGSNHPQEIAISIAAQLIQEHDRCVSEMADVECRTAGP